jgi:hypothetical protein
MLNKIIGATIESVTVTVIGLAIILLTILVWEELKHKK